MSQASLSDRSARASAGETLAGCSLSPAEFRLFQTFIFEAAGISLSDAKMALVTGRLGKRVKQCGCASFKAYFDYIDAARPSAEQLRERQMAVDLLTTNETYFYREPRHFQLLQDQILPQWTRGSYRLWSAACSTGEEPYTLAMVLSAHCPSDRWEIIGSDISSRVLEVARAAQYPLERVGRLPKPLLHQYCLKGTGGKAGTVLVERALRAKVSFRQVNLKEPNRQLGLFDVIFLRNVMIYFSRETKQQIVQLVLERLKPGGWLFIGHSESLHGISDAVRLVQPSVYRKHG